LPIEIDKYTFKHNFLKEIDRAWRDAKQNIERSAEYTKNRHDAKYEPTRFEVGDKVRLWAPATRVGLKTKLRHDLFKGPYVITRTWPSGNVEINVNGKRRVVHANNIKKAEPIRTEIKEVSRLVESHKRAAAANSSKANGQSQNKGSRHDVDTSGEARIPYLTRFGRQTERPTSYA
jgi:hypothetical protein